MDSQLRCYANQMMKEYNYYYQFKPTKWKTIAAKLLTNPLTYSFSNKLILHPKKPSMQEKWSGSLGS